MNAYYLNQFISTTLSTAGGIDDSQTTGIKIASTSGITTDKPGILCLSYSSSIDTTKAEWITYTSIDISNELQGVTRGAEGFSAKSHSNGVAVAFPISKSHINNLNDALIIGGDETNLLEGVLDEDTFASDSATKGATQQSIKAYIDTDGGSLGGWTSANETWTYSSVDDPTGVFTVASDVTSKYSAGMRIKFTNATNTIYGIITAVSESGGTTTITFLHEIDSTDNLALTLMADSAITANYYSTQKAPQGFPLDPDKWSIEVTDSTNRSQSTPTQNIWYNVGTTNSQISVPIGSWDLSYKAILHTSTTTDAQITLSKANNTEDDADFTMYLFNGDSMMISATYNKSIILSSKTTYYLNALRSGSTAGDLLFYNSRGNMVLRAICAYL